MKNDVVFILAVFYRYYDKGSTQLVAYQSAVVALLLLVYMNLLALTVFLGIEGPSFLKLPENKLAQYLIGLAILISFYLITVKVFKKETVKKYKLSDKQCFWGGVGLVFYIVLSIFAIVLAVKTMS